MRRHRWIGAAMIIGTTLAGPTAASADGGAFLDLDGTHYLPGQTARVESYVSVPAAKQDLFERGPFYLFVVPERSSVVEGRPIPDSAVRVASFSIEEQRGTAFELHASFVVPDLAGDSYGLWVCNDPCTISGFREPLTGSISIVATAREGALLRQLDVLSRRNWSLHRQVRKAERATDEVEAQLLDVARSELAIDLREQTATDARPAPTSDRRPLIPAWAAVILTIGLLVLAVAIVIRSKRRSEQLVLDPIPELERERELASR